MTLHQRLQASAERSGVPTCETCGTRHHGAAWTPSVGWHDASHPIPAESSARTLDVLIPERVTLSPFTRRALAGELPAKIVR